MCVFLLLYYVCLRRLRSLRLRSPLSLFYHTQCSPHPPASQAHRLGVRHFCSVASSCRTQSCKLQEREQQQHSREQTQRARGACMEAQSAERASRESEQRGEARRAARQQQLSKEQQQRGSGRQRTRVHVAHSREHRTTLHTALRRHAAHRNRWRAAAPPPTPQHRGEYATNTQ